MREIKPDVFRAYDIRGVVDQDFDSAWVETLGRACGALFRDRGWNSAVLGHDCRHSSPEYVDALAVGLRATGVDIIMLGMVSTPLFYYGVKTLERHAGIMVTASHNPPEYNGFKVWCGETTIFGEDIREIYQLMLAGEFPNGAGLLCDHDVFPAYLEELTSGVRRGTPAKVVVDGGNGSAGEICAAVLRKAGVEVIPIFCEPDGDFPNHHPDPVVEKNLDALKETVLREGADCGIGLDGDGDRLGVVDDLGRLIPGDRLLAIFARDVLTKNPGAQVIAEAKCSHLLYRDIEAHGGRSIMGVTGHSVMKARMIETGALLAGEMSGHIFFADRFYGFDDAVYAALRLVEILSRNSKRPLSRYLGDWPKTSATPELRIFCPDDVKFSLVERAAREFGKRFETVTVDGVRVLFPDGWALVRASNTQPALSMRFEAETPEGLEAIRAIVEKPVLRWIEEMSA